MISQTCQHKQSRVVDSRDAQGNSTRRRRECEHCGHRWTTYEVSAEQYEAMISLIEQESSLRLLRELLYHVTTALEQNRKLKSIRCPTSPTTQ